MTSVHHVNHLKGRLLDLRGRGHHVQVVHVLLFRLLCGRRVHRVIRTMLI